MAKGNKSEQKDRWIAATAHANKARLITDDSPLILEAKEVEISVTNSTCALLEICTDAGEPYVEKNNRVGPLKEQTGHLFARTNFFSPPKGECRSAMDLEGLAHIFYDGSKKSWIAEVKDCRPLEIKAEFEGRKDSTVALNFRYFKNQHLGGKLTFRAGIEGKTISSKSVSVDPLWAIGEVGPMHIGQSRMKTNHVEGLHSLAIGSGEINKKAWKTLLVEKSLLPSCSDIDMLEAALRNIVVNGRGVFKPVLQQYYIAFSCERPK